jgi:hypothetical protein
VRWVRLHFDNVGIIGVIPHLQLRSSDRPEVLGSFWQEGLLTTPEETRQLKALDKEARKQRENPSTPFEQLW